jgi:arsenite-transporting ATPase
LQAQDAIVAEQLRLTASLKKMGVYQRYVVQNRYHANEEIYWDLFPDQTLIRLPSLPRSVEPLARVKGAADSVILKVISLIKSDFLTPSITQSPRQFSF